MTAGAVFAVLALALIASGYAVFNTREVPAQKMRAVLLAKAESDLVAAQCELENWSAEVPKLKARVARLRAEVEVFVDQLERCAT